MSAQGRHTCSSCGVSAPADPTRRGCGLPRGWEHRDPRACTTCVWTTQRPAAELAQPVCGACVLAMLEAVLDAFRTGATRRTTGAV